MLGEKKLVVCQNQHRRDAFDKRVQQELSNEDVQQGIEDIRAAGSC